MVSLGRQLLPVVLGLSRGAILLHDSVRARSTPTSEGRDSTANSPRPHSPPAKPARTGVPGLLLRPDDPPIASLLILPGIGDRAQFWSAVQRMLAEERIASLVVTYRAQNMTPAQLNRAALAGASALRAQGPHPTALFVLGFSLGSGIATELAGSLQPAPAGLILCQAYTSFFAAAHRIATLTGPFGSMLPVHAVEDLWATRSLLEAVRVPLAIVHATGDTLFPASMAHELFAAARNAAPHNTHAIAPELHLIAGLHHNALYQRVPAAYWQPILRFVRRVVAELPVAESPVMSKREELTRDSMIPHGTK